MAVLTGNTTAIAIALTTADLAEQPAGGWGSWMQPIQSPAPNNPVGTNATIYTLTTTEIQTLRNSGLITDETSLFYQLRIKNTTLKTQQTSDVYSFQLTSSRVFRALAVLMRYGFISQFSIDTLNLSWVKIVSAMSDAEIRSNWVKKISNDLEYTYEVLNLQRGNSTTSNANPTTLYSGYSITYLMLGDCLNHLSAAKNNVASPYIGNISVTWNPPILGAGVSAEELRSLHQPNLIGDGFYCYCTIRSLKAGSNQAIAPSFFLENWNITPDTLLSVIWRLREATIISAIAASNFTIQWLAPVPQYNWSWADKMQRTFFKQAGDFMFTLGALNTEHSSTQTFNLIDTMRKAGIRLYPKNPNENLAESGINLLLRMVSNQVVTITETDPISITWAY